MEVSAVFSTEEINQQAKLILNYPAFKNSPVLSRFLEYIIEETIHKRESMIKEYTIAIHVLWRSRDFNPNQDSIVRIHAGRLRRALTDYYLTHGMYDPITIQIPKGCYVPEFVASGAVEPSGDPVYTLPKKGHKPMVAIFPLCMNEKEVDELPALLEGRLKEKLLRFRDIAVLGYYSTNMKEKIQENVLEAGKTVGADYIITGNLAHVGQQIRILINLLVTATGEVLLCKSFDRNILPIGTETQDSIIQDFVAFADGCYRSILQDRQNPA